MYLCQWCVTEGLSLLNESLVCASYPTNLGPGDIQGFKMKEQGSHFILRFPNEDESAILLLSKPLCMYDMYVYDLYT